MLSISDLAHQFDLSVLALIPLHHPVNVLVVFPFNDDQ